MNLPLPRTRPGLPPRIARAAMLALLSTLAATNASAESLPEPRSLIDRHVAAIGGEEAIRMSGDATVRARVEIEENGMQGSMLMHSRDDDMMLRMSIAGMELRMGQIDGVSWSIDPMHGPRLIEGEELASKQNRQDPDVLAYSEEAIASMKTVAVSDSEGRPCYRVEIAWKNGMNTVDCFGTTVPWLLSSEQTEVSPMGELRQTMHFYDYTEHGDLTIATRMRMKAGGVTQIITIEEIDLVTPPDEVFALPPAIVALLESAGRETADGTGSATPAAKQQ